ncbi:MAG TPA: glycosyltransferase [bacterium]|nr:glycosyltransferase [bacterium]
MITIMLPAFNEAGSIGNLLDSFIRAFEEEKRRWRIILVDDGSSDGTGDIARSYQGTIDIEVVAHSVNRGLAEALKTGLIRAVETAADDEIIITMDSDGSHLPGLVFRMVRLVKEGHDVVIASRYRAGSRIRGVSLFRRLMSRGAAILCKLTFPIRGVRDYTCGYRAYKAFLLKRVFTDYGQEIISEPGFSCMVDLLLKVNRYEPIITEVPFILRYDLKAGPSKMNVKLTVKQTLMLLLRRRLGLK